MVSQDRKCYLCESEGAMCGNCQHDAEIAMPDDVMEQGGTGVSSLTKDGVLFGANTTTMGFATGANGNILQIAANGTPTFGVNILDGGDF